MVGHVQNHVLRLGQSSRARIAGRREELADSRRGGQFAGDGVFAATAADDEHFFRHFQRDRRWLPRGRRFDYLGRTTAQQTLEDGRWLFSVPIDDQSGRFRVDLTVT